MEHYFIRQSQKGLSDAKDYFIGGSAYPEMIGPFNHSYQEYWFYYQIGPIVDPEYSPSQTGDVLFKVNTKTYLKQFK